MGRGSGLSVVGFQSLCGNPLCCIIKPAEDDSVIEPFLVHNGTLIWTKIICHKTITDSVSLPATGSQTIDLQITAAYTQFHIQCEEIELKTLPLSNLLKNKLLGTGLFKKCPVK